MRGEVFGVRSRSEVLGTVFSRSEAENSKEKD